MNYGGRDYNAIQNAGQNLVSNRGYSAYKDNRYQNDYNQNQGYNRNYNPNINSSDSSRYDELDILDLYSQPLLQKQGGDLISNLSSIQLGQNKRNNIPNIRGVSANARNNVPQYQIPYPPPPPYSYQPQYAPPYQAYSQRRRDSSNEASKLLQSQLDKQNDILSQLVNSIDKNKPAQMNQVSQPQTDYNYRLKEMEKEFSLMNEIQNLRREISQIQASKNSAINPLLQQQQQQQQQFQMMQMQQMMMNPYNNPMMMMLMNQMQQQNQGSNQQQQQPPYPPNPYGYPPFYPPPYGYPPPPPQQNNQKKDDENRLEELLKELLKEKALNNALKNENINRPQQNQTRNSMQLRTLPSRQSSNNGNNYMNITNPDEPIDNQSNQLTQQSVKKPKKVDTRHAKKILGYFVLFIRWIKLEVIKSKQQFKQYEIEEFKADYISAVEAALPWLINCSTKAFNTIANNSKKEQDITDLAIKKANAKEQDLRFTNYTEECNFIIDEMIRGLESIPEGLSLFIVKKFYDNSYFSNEPTFLFEFETDRLEFDPTDQKLLNIDNNPDSPRFKMLILIFILVKIYIPQILIKPWTQQLNPTVKINENYISSKKLSIICSIIYQQLMDYLNATVPLVPKKPNQVSWNPIPTSIIVNNSRVDLKAQNNSKEELLTLLVTKDQLSVFYSKRQDWVNSFKKKLDQFATTFRQKLQSNRATFLELRKELLQEKAKELQRFIPARLRNVQVSN